MSLESHNNTRIAKNTILLYFRMLLTLLVGLYTSRVVLETLGISDYGLYNVVGGVVTMFTFLNGTLTSSTQRYLNFELGTGNVEKLKNVFSTALIQHIILIFIIVLLAETIGLWFVCNKLNIDVGRETAAFWVYQFSIITVCFQILQLPYMSAIIAHEKMGAFAYISIWDVTIKLVAVYIIQVIESDKLIMYAFFYLLIHITNVLIYIIYSRSHFSETKSKLNYDKPLFKEMLSFGGWNVIGFLASTCNNQGLNILFNLFFGTTINAARGIAFQVNGIVNQFASNFQMAVKPQVIKYYAENRYDEMTKLVYNSAKFSAILMLILSVPLAIEIEYILALWLGEYPAYTPNFIRIILFHSVIISMISPIIMVVHASGRLKAISVTAGLLNLSILPLNYLLLKLGCSPEIALSINVLASLVETFIELYWMKHYINFSVAGFYRNVYKPVFLCGLIMMIPPFLVYLYLPLLNDFLHFMCVCTTSLLTSVFVCYKFALDNDKRRVIKRKISTITKLAK